MKLKDFVIFNPKEKLVKNEIYRKISMDQITPFTRYIKSENFESYKGGSKFKNGDTIFARITPCLENGKTCFVNSLNNDEIAFGSTEFIIVRAKQGISLPLFVFYLFTTEKIRSKAIISMTGSSGRERVQQVALDNIEIPNYPLTFQQHIVNTIGSVDDLIENYQKQADKICNILRQSLNKYNEYVTISEYDPDIIKSGIKMFDNEKTYLDTSSINGVNNITPGELITYNKKPSRANMQPIVGSVWFAKMKDSNKILIITDKDQDIIKNNILSTGFLGIKSSNKLPLSLLTSIIISDQFKVQRDLNSVGTTMAGINNETFSKILVPKLTDEEKKKYDKKYNNFVYRLSYIRQEIKLLSKVKENLLSKHF